MADNTEDSRSVEFVTAFDRFLRDGDDISRYQQWQKGVIVTVPTNGWVIIRKRFDKNRMIVEDRGTIVINPVFEEYIFAPRNSATIDYSTETNNFKFQTDIHNDGVEVEVDPVVTVRISDPITYLLSSNSVLADLKDLVCSILRSFVSEHTDKELLRRHFTLAQIDSDGLLDDFELNYGLRVESLRIKNIKLPKEITDARTATAQAKEEVNRAEFEKRTAIFRAEAEMQYNDRFVQSIQTARELGFSDGLIGEMIGHYSVRNAPEGSRVILGNNSSMGGYFPAWMLENSHPQQLTHEDEVVTYDEDGIVIEEGNARGRKR